MTDEISDERTPLLQDGVARSVAEHNSEGESPSTNDSGTGTWNPSPTPLPLRTLTMVMLLTAMPPIVFEVIFPFINQMILEVGIVTDPEQVGFYSGLVESLFSLMSFITVLPTSYLSDRIGRKPIIIGGSLAMAASAVAFGLSKTLLAMIVSRCVGGASGSVWMASRIVLAEATDKSNQGKAFQFYTVAYRTGQIIGLPLGGLLAHPERNFPLFRTKFWIENPFALPCFVAAGFGVLVVILSCIFLDETLPSKRKSGSKPQTSPPASPLERVPEQPSPSMKTVLTPPVISLLISNVAMCWASETLFSVYPLYSFTPVASGGLGLSEAAIGIQMAIRAFLHIGIMPFYSTLEQRFGGPVRFYRITMWAWPVVVLYMPFLNILARIFGSYSWPVNVALVIFYLFWGLCGYAWTSISIMVTNASPSASALSTINSLSQMAIILPQAVAPAFTTSLFALSIKSAIVHGNLIWLVLLIFTCGGALQSMSLKEPTSDWRKMTDASN